MDRIGNRRCWARRPQLQCPMRTRGVVVGGVTGKDPVQMPLAEDQHPVGGLCTDRQHEAFGEAVGAWTPRRDLDHLDARVRQDRIERRRELTGPIAYEEPEPAGVLARSISRLRACRVWGSETPHLPLSSGYWRTRTVRHDRCRVAPVAYADTCLGPIPPPHSSRASIGSSRRCRSTRRWPGIDSYCAGRPGSRIGGGRWRTPAAWAAIGRSG